MNIDIDKIAKKRQYKVRGKVLSFTLLPNNVGKLLIYKGVGKNKKHFMFTTFGENTKKLSKISEQYRIKIWFSIKCSNYNEKWFTELLLESFEYWKVNEDKIKKEQNQLKIIEENQYLKSIVKNNCAHNQ